MRVLERPAWPARHHAGIAAAVMVALTATLPLSPALAQVAEASAARSIDFDLPAQPVSRALQAWSAATGTAVTAPPGLAQTSRAVKGSMTGMDALRQLLEGTGLAARVVAGAVVVEAAPATGDARVLGPVRVAGVTAGAGGNAVGVNGSTDITATEGSGSYTAVAVRLGGKSPQEIKDLPQTVSVITADQLRDQKLNTLMDAVAQAPGITVINEGGALPAIYSRGWAVTQVQIDGSAPMNITTNTSDASGAPGQRSMRAQFDLAMYDHVELLRGADGLYNGAGSPGGVLNLARKRPLNRTQVVGELSVGSWDDTRLVLDASAPLAFNGRLRGRAVVSAEDKHQFYKNGMERHHTLYGVLEGEVAQGTTLSGGLVYANWNMRPFYSGLPRYGNGDSLPVPASTSYVFPWAYDKTRSNELFMRVEQKLGDDWSATLNVARVDQKIDSVSGNVYGTFYTDTQAGTSWGAGKGYGPTTQNTADFTLLGAFQLLGLRQEVVAGANYMAWIGEGGQYYFSNGGNQPFNPVTGDTNSIAEPGFTAASSVPVNRVTQRGVYVNLRLTPWEPLHFTLGARYNDYRYKNRMEFINSNPLPTTEHEQAHTALPAKVAVSFDVTKTISVYFGRSDVYANQSLLVQEDGTPLDPITGSNKEAGVKWASADGRQTASLAAYDTTQYGRSVSLPFGRFGQWASTFGSLPDGRQCCFVTTDAPYKSKGLDLAYGGEVLKGLDLTAGYSYNKSTQVPIILAWQNATPTPLQPRAPRRSLKLAARYRFQDEGMLGRLTLGLAAQAQEGTLITGTTCPGTSINSRFGVFCSVNTVNYTFQQGGYTILSGLARYQFSDKTSLDLNIGNLTNKQYYQTIGTTSGGNFFGAPRSFMASLRSEF